MKRQNDRIEKVIEKVVTHMVGAELYGWPPQCMSFLYQPVRPEKTEKVLSHNEENSHK